jgi:hypothetical protein
MKSRRKTSRRELLASTLALPSVALATATPVSAQEKAGNLGEATQREHALLLDKLACRTLMETYWVAEAMRDADLFASIWSEDAVFGSIKGRANIHARAVQIMKGLETTDLRSAPAGWHVTIDGDTGRGRFYLLAHLRRHLPDGTYKLSLSDATYQTEFVRTPNGWRVSKCGGLNNPQSLHDTDIRAEFPGPLV